MHKLALAALAAICLSSVAFAEEATSSKAPATATTSSPMSESEMDKVVAGYSTANNGLNGGGGLGNCCGQGYFRNSGNGRF